ncbi:putative aarF domain-containing protein kinase, chloroplastic [Ananas comosus]|uniref:Putative aarF domain-containing protein kinase, chloroplastic n=1 Tax=Ananas comosus TaxID=4615 RepID=A0A199V5R3_ANACO|nr:putative aarF domain-containing protein kinase, chloroplastic [Ananas comosus]
MLLLFVPSPPLFPAKFKSETLTPWYGSLRSPRLARSFRRIPFPSPPRRRQRSPPPPISAAVSVGSGEDDAFTKYSGYLFEGGASSEAEFLEEYNLLAITAIYRRKPFLVLRRFVQIGTTFGRWFAFRYLDGVLDRSDEMFKIRAAELRMILLELGPAFVKIAQAVSSRPDVIPPAYLDELSLLQDRIAPFSTEVGFNIIEKELGLPVDMLYSEITPEPIAAASLGQVYQARLRSSGKVVAVKVQRPGVQAAISLDIYILRYVAGLVRRVANLNTDLQAVLDEWASSLFREMDYRAEARNGAKFRELYGRLKDVMVPEMYMEQTSRRVLTMEWVEGKKLSEVKDIYLVEVGVYCSLSQLLDYGFYHADPHPGNLLRTSDGKLAYLDFGMMGEFRQELRDGFIEACLHLVNRDFDALAKDFITLGLLPPTTQKDEVTKALTDVFQNAVNKGVRNISFGDLSGNLGRTMYAFFCTNLSFRYPHISLSSFGESRHSPLSCYNAQLFSLAVLEGIAISFDPNYKVLSSSYPWIARKVLTDSSPKLRATLQTLLYKDGVFRIDRLESLLTESLRARTEQSLVRGEVEETDSRAAIKQVMTFTLTDKGAFVREIILQEVAKGIDALGMATLDTITSTAASRLPFVISYSSSSMGHEDIANLQTLRRLLLLLSKLQKNESSTAEVRYANAEEKENSKAEEVSLVLYEMTSVQEFLPVLSVIPELPSESQQQLLLLPVDLAGRLLSRVVARTVRRIFL